ncbi:hypothetical protein MTO96_036923 [Rhipicephalus appendiculatus]
MKRTERALDECRLVAGDSQFIEVQLAKHKLLMNDIQAHQGSVDTLNRAGHQLMKDGHSEDTSVTQTKLADLNDLWNALQDKAAECQHQLAAALREAQDFNREIQEFLMWLSDSGGQPASSKPVGGLQATLAKPRGKCRVPCGRPTAVRLEARQLLLDRREPIFDGASASVLLYIAARNVLVLPAGALRPSLFYSNGPASHNYGGIGQMAGSELMRGFDIKGMAYDDEGRNRPWGTTAQRVQLTSNALCLSKSFRELVGDEAPKARFNAAVEPDLELLADFAGLETAYAAFQKLPREVREMRLPHTSLEP